MSSFLVCFLFVSLIISTIVLLFNRASSKLNVIYDQISQIKHDLIMKEKELFILRKDVLTQLELIKEQKEIEIKGYVYNPSKDMDKKLRGDGDAIFE